MVVVFCTSSRNSGVNWYGRPRQQGFRRGLRVSRLSGSYLRPAAQLTAGWPWHASLTCLHRQQSTFGRQTARQHDEPSARNLRRGSRTSSS